MFITRRKKNGVITCRFFSTVLGMSVNMDVILLQQTWGQIGMEGKGAERLVAEGKVLPRLYAWCGMGDFLYQGNLKAWEHVKKLGYDLTCEESAGDHQWKYWDEKIQDVLRWWLGTDMDLR